MHYYVVGVNGSGKTTLLKAIAAETGIEAVHGTTELMHYLGIPGNYDALRTMDQGEVLEKWRETAEQLVEANGDKSLFVDTHIMNLTHGNVVRRDGDWIAKYDAMILVKAKPAVILSRVLQDAGKDRALFPAGISESEKLAMLDDYQRQTEKLFVALCREYDLPSLIIENDASIAEGVQMFVKSSLYS
jgi:adenylate kinase